MGPSNRKLTTYLPEQNEWSGGGTGPSRPASPPPVPGTPPRLSSWIQYTYFLRIPLLGWITLPFFCYLDGCTGASALTRGIMTMSRGWQIFHVTFFSVALLMAVLICAKNIVNNGEERFASPPPDRLRRILTSAEPRTMWLTLAVAQLPAAVTLVYVTCRTISEQTGWAHGRRDERAVLATVWPYGGWHWRLFAAMGAGLLMAALFWYLVSVFYYWTYPAPSDKTGPAAAAQARDMQTGVATPLLFPVSAVPCAEGSDPDGVPRSPWYRMRGGFGLTQRARCAEKPSFAQWIESLARRVLRVVRSGYAAQGSDRLYELHFLSAVSLGGFLLLYFFLYPLVAPVVVTQGFGAVALLAVLFFVAFAAGSITWKHQRMEPVGLLFTSIMLGGLLVFLGFYHVDSTHRRILMETSFPTLGSILVILVFSQWLFCGASFFLDRYRLPVLSAVLFLVFLPKLIPGIDQDHYFDVKPSAALASRSVDAPAEAILHRMPQQRAGEPMVVVTAMGGGIQAAQWTAQIMAKMESTFRDSPGLQPFHYTLHDHLLLASGVSGGSVGLMPFLLEYTAPAGSQFGSGNDNPALRQQLRARLTTAPGCSSLEAVSWGLEYYDLQRFLLTVRFPWFQSTHTGSTPDRTWALTEALNRNLNDKDCSTDDFPALAPLSSAKDLTLGQAARSLQAGSMPAFTFNTTVAETGDRFLLSNYAIPSNAKPQAIGGTLLLKGSDSLPAESFLQAYAMEDCCGGKGRHADLSLATAARLSATFPVVSSGTRIPREYADIASHFLDGGYFDNDGTASVIEFLLSAADARSQEHREHPDKALPPLKVLLVEIRDGNDMNSGINDDDLSHQTGHAPDRVNATPLKPWSTFTQMGAPLQGMWNAGHKSTTRRNRRELCVLEHAYSGEGLEIHHVVFGIPSEPLREADPQKGVTATYKASPLSWKLTESQKEYIRRWTNTEKATQDSMADAVDYIRKTLQAKQDGGKDQAAPPNTSGHAPTSAANNDCTVDDEPVYN